MTIIVGAGLAGLTCAKVLYEAGRPCLVLEAEATAGGRVRSERRLACCRRERAMTYFFLPSLRRTVSPA